MSNTPSTVLVVDDQRETLDMLSDALQLEGMVPIVAADGPAALAKISKSVPDMVLLDAMMPGMDGFEVCSVAKTEMGLADLPIIFMTGRSDSEHVVRALACGGIDFVPKPIVLEELFARMRVHLINARKARSAREALDSMGRSIVAADGDGAILWATPQAHDLLTRLGIRADERAALPWEIKNLLREQGASRTLERFGRKIEFRLVESRADGPMLLRLIDHDAGTQEERLARAFNISLREAEVLMWLTHGKSNKEIAEILDLSPRTVNKHLEQIFEKLGIENRTAAATMSVRVLWD